MTTWIDKALCAAVFFSLAAACSRKGADVHATPKGAAAPPPAPASGAATNASTPGSESGQGAVSRDAHGSGGGGGGGHGGHETAGGGGEHGGNGSGGGSGGHGGHGTGGGGGGHGGNGRGGGGGGGDDSVEPLPPEQRGHRFREAAVYFDGQPIAALAFGELPPTVKPHWVEIEKDYKVRRFVLTEYLDGLGIDIKKLKAIHFYGGRTRLAVLDGSEVRRQGKRILFSFTQGDTGKPRFHWPPHTRVNDTIDKIMNVAIYQDKKPPTWDNERYVLVLDGEELEGEIPYATSELRGGTRVYLDGRLVANVKRNAVESLHLASTSTGAIPRWSLRGFLDASRVELDGAKTYDIVNEDELVGRFPASELRELQFGFVEKGGGQTYIRPKNALATAILLYAKKRPPALADRR